MGSNPATRTMHVSFRVFGYELWSLDIARPELFQPEEQFDDDTEDIPFGFTSE